MPNRIIKDTINESKSLNECSIFAQDLYKRLITYADDYGRFNADTVVMRARLFPRELDVVSEEDVVNGLVELVGAMKVSFYTPSVFNQYGKKGVYGAFPNWGEHQRIRNSKHKCPEPEDTTVNDWYLRRFIPMDLKTRVIERDNFKCQVCGKQITTCRDAKRFIKMGTGLYHIDHIVPVLQGGRATEENLRLTCPECNMKRKKQFSFDEILAFSDGTQKFAANCGEPQSESNPIQSESNPIQSESNPNPNIYKSECKEVIDYLNEKAKTKYKYADSNIKYISARLREGFTVDDCKTVIDKKCLDWMGTEYEQYLRPKTLFGNKFEGYLNANVRPRQKDHVVIDMPDYMRTAQQKEYDPDEELPF